MVVDDKYVDDKIFLFTNGKRFFFQNFQRLEDAAFFSESNKKYVLLVVQKFKFHFTE